MRERESTEEKAQKYRGVYRLIQEVRRMYLRRSGRIQEEVRWRPARRQRWSMAGPS